VAVNAIHYLALTVAGISWGGGFPLAKLTLTELGAAHRILARSIIASCLALPLILLTPETRKALVDTRVILAGAV
jgi:drug/metabolite transporter (DMT)-like permease